jgi:excisionase family DNA binding protein
MNPKTLKIIELALQMDRTIDTAERARIIRLVTSADAGATTHGDTHPQTPFLTPKDAAKYLGISKRTLARYVKEGRIKPGRINGRVLRFRWSDLDRLVCGDTLTPQDPPR